MQKYETAKYTMGTDNQSLSTRDYYNQMYTEGVRRSWHVSKLNVPKRIYRILLENGLTHIEFIMRKPESSLREMWGIGDKTLDLIKKALYDIGLDWPAKPQNRPEKNFVDPDTMM